MNTQGEPQLNEQAKPAVELSIETRMGENAPEYQLRLTVGVQSFTICQPRETMAEATWLMEQFGKALDAAPYPTADAPLPAMSDEACVMLDELDADAGYLFGRVVVAGIDGAEECAKAMAEAVRAKVRKIKTALAAASPPLFVSLHEGPVSLGVTPPAQGDRALLEQALEAIVHAQQSGVGNSPTLVAALRQRLKESC